MLPFHEAVADGGPAVVPTDDARSHTKKGTGLGLAICAWIAEAHHGHIEVQSEVGKGSTFTIVLPLAPLTA